MKFADAAYVTETDPLSALWLPAFVRHVAVISAVVTQRHVRILLPARGSAKAVSLDKDYCEHAPHMRPQQLQCP